MISEAPAMRSPIIAHGCASLVALALLSGCPLLLDDDFSTPVAAAGSSGASGAGGSAAGSGSDAGTSASGGAAASGAGTSSGGAGSGGSGGASACGDDACRTCDAATNGCDCGPTLPEVCEALRAALVHQYRFEGMGGGAVDSRGDAHGSLVNASLTGTGSLELTATGAEQYVDLPNGIVSRLVDATIEVWLVWHGGPGWQRVFDFGSSSSGNGNGATYLFFTPRTNLVPGDNEPMRLTYSNAGFSGEIEIDVRPGLPQDRLVHVAAVVDDSRDRLALYVDGALAGEAAFTATLAELDDVNNWIGRSQFDEDPGLDAEILELRLYAAALDGDAIAESFRAGPDAAFLTP